MATWVEDIVQALENLGGQAHRRDIINEVARIRQEPLPKNIDETVQERIQAHSSDSSHFMGKQDLFSKIGNGFWALKDISQSPALEPAAISNSPELTIRQREGQKGSKEWVDVITLAIKNLGGQATLNDIYKEVNRIKPCSVMKLRGEIYRHSSDTSEFKGNDYFKQVRQGVWALRDYPLNLIHPQSISIGGNATKKKELPSASLEEIENILHTIKQYRDYESPDSVTWKEYINEFFHIIGFSTNDINQRLMTLNLMGANHTPKAIVCYVIPGEKFDEITSGLEWESFLFYASKFHQVGWGILTDGLQLKIFDFEDHNRKQPYHWQDLDGIICQQKLDTFCTIYKSFCNIKRTSSNPASGQGDKTTGGQDHNYGGLNKGQALRLKFWGKLLEKSKLITKLHSNVSPNPGGWISASAGKSGLQFNYVLGLDGVRIELYIDQGHTEWNKEVFNTLLLHKSEIEQVFGDELDWQLLPTKKASRIRYLFSGNGLNDPGHWEELQNQMIDSMIRMEKAFRPFIDQLR